MPGPKPNTTMENTAIAEQFFAQVSESIQLVFDLTSRIDERVKMLIERQNELDAKIEKLFDAHQVLLNRLSIIEAKEYPQLKEDLMHVKQSIPRIQKNEDDLSDAESRVNALETKIEILTARLGNHDNRWLLAFDAIWKIGLMVIAGYILFKLGLQAPPS